MTINDEKFLKWLNDDIGAILKSFKTTLIVRDPYFLFGCTKLNKNIEQLISFSPSQLKKEITKTVTTNISPQLTPPLPKWDQ